MLFLMMKFLTDCKNSDCHDDNINAILECYLNQPKIPDLVHNLLSITCIHEQEMQDEELLALQASRLMKTLMTSFVMYILVKILVNNDTLPCLSKCWSKLSIGSNMEKSICMKRSNNAIIIPSSDKPSTSSSVSIANDTNCLAKDMDY